MIVAVIDLGSNAVRMFIAEVNGKNINIIKRFRHNVRLSEGMSRTMMLQPEAVSRTVAALQELSGHIKEYSADKVIAVATAAMRNAKNKEVILNPLKEMGINLRIIDGLTEANYDYIGVINTMNVKNCVIMDIGGASTEIIVVKDGKNIDMISLPIGAVVLKEEYIKNHDAPNCTLAAEKYISERFENLKFLDKAQNFDIVALGGTARALGQISEHSTDIQSGYCVTKDRALDIIRKVNTMTLEEIKNNVTVEKKRADIVKSGFVFIECMIKRINSEKVIIGRCGVREGILYESAH